MARRTSTIGRGRSLAKGPVTVIGALCLVFGVGALLFGSHHFGLNVPHGAAHGKLWLKVKVNGWTGLLFVAAGLALILGALAHWSARTVSLLVGLVFLAAAIVGVIRGNGVFGIFAANHRTEATWAVAGILLLVCARLPRRGALRTRSAPLATGGRAGTDAP